MILKAGRLGEPFLPSGRRRFCDVISKPPVPSQPLPNQNQPPAGPAPQATVQPARGLGRSPIKKSSTSLCTPVRRSRESCAA